MTRGEDRSLYSHSVFFFSPSGCYLETCLISFKIQILAISVSLGQRSIFC